MKLQYESKSFNVMAFLLAVGLLITAFNSTSAAESASSVERSPKTVATFADRGIADTVDFDTQRNVDSFTPPADDAGDSSVPQIAFDANGNALAVWVQSDGTRKNIWANRFTPDTGWGTAELIEMDYSGVVSVPQIAVDVDGNALAVWVQFDGIRDGIWTNRFTIEAGWGTAERIETDSAGAGSPQIAIDANGDALAVWVQSGSSGKDIWANRFTPEAGWGTAELIEINGIVAGNPQIAFDANGNALAVWAQFDGSHNHIWANRFTVAVGWGAAERIQTHTDYGGNAYAPQIAVDVNGNALAVWQQRDLSLNTTNIWANRFTVEAGWSVAELIETDNAGDAGHAQIGFDANGDALAVWQQSDGSRTNIWTNRFTEAGWGSCEGLEMHDGVRDRYTPQIAVDASGNALVVWRQADSSGLNIQASRFSVGVGWGDAEQIQIYASDYGSYGYDPQVAVDASGNALAVWMQNDANFRLSIWANHFTAATGWGDAEVIDTDGLPGPVTSFEMLDPTPGMGDQFGRSVVILANGNIVVSDPFDSSVAVNNGAVHLYNPYTQTLVASFYGDIANNYFGFESVTVLDNSNFVITSPGDDVDGVVNAGSVKLVHGANGVQIGDDIVGDEANDRLGSDGITALANNNFVIASGRDDENNIIDSGSVILVNGATGAQIGTTIAGNNHGDRLGSNVHTRSGITTLANGNYVIAAPFDNVHGQENAGSVRLVNGATGAQIRAANGRAGDFLGLDGITALANNNYVIASSLADVSGGRSGTVIDAGTVMLMHGVTGAQIGDTLSGSTKNDSLGSNGVTALANNNYVVLSAGEDVPFIADAGSARLINGRTSAQISLIVGDTSGDFIGSSATALANNNLVIAAPEYDSVGGRDGSRIANAGAVRLINGVNGELISRVNGQHSGDFRDSSITVLTNSNFVIAQPWARVDLVFNAGSVKLIGRTGELINSFFGRNPGDFNNLSVTPMVTNNFVLAAPWYDQGSSVNTGNVLLIDGRTGTRINGIQSITAEDRLGSGGITALSNDNYVIVSPLDDIDGVVDAGSVRVMRSHGFPLGNTMGRVANDIEDATVTVSAAGDSFILGLPSMDSNDLVDSGFVRLIAE